MVAGLHDSGEQMLIKAALATDEISVPASLSVLLYDDSTDALGDGDGLGAVTTEPGDGNYVRKAVATDGSGTFDGDLESGATGGDYGVSLPALTWDVEGTTGTVDAYALVASVQLDGEDAATEHVIASATLDQSRTLDDLDVLNTNAGGGITLN